MTVYIVVGLPGAGKTTRAKELEVSERALRLTPDHWQMAIFHDDDPNRWRSRERAEHRDQIEGKLIEVGMRAAWLGLDVVLDFGVWARDERSALRWMASTLGVEAQVVYLPVDLAEQRSRIMTRFTTEAGQFQMTDEDLEQWQVLFQIPDDAELAGLDLPAVPAGFDGWWPWARTRWPSLPAEITSWMVG